MDKPVLSVVIAAKDPPRELLRLCIASFAALRHAPALEVVIVGSGKVPVLPDELASSFAHFRIVDVPAAGVYAAYNAGCLEATGTHVLFFGVDDVALPGMDAVIATLSSDPGSYHLYAAACYMQSAGISQPSRWRVSLALRNWCHQGIFYLRGHLVEHPYQIEYRAQADHKMNIDIVSNRSLRFGVSNELVAYFSAGGVSSLRPDLQFRRDFPEIVAHAYGRPWGMLVKLKQRVIDSILGEPEKRFRARTRQ